MDHSADIYALVPRTHGLFGHVYVLFLGYVITHIYDLAKVLTMRNPKDYAPTLSSNRRPPRVAQGDELAATGPAAKAYVARQVTSVEDTSVACSDENQEDDRLIDFTTNVYV
jgi:hypothetical protein